jgi:hypothetical protein
MRGKLEAEAIMHKVYQWRKTTQVFDAHYKNVSYDPRPFCGGWCPCNLFSYMAFRYDDTPDVFPEIFQVCHGYCDSQT